MHAGAVVASVEMTNAVRLALNFAAQHTTFELVDDTPKFFDIALRFGAIIRKHPHQSLWWRRAFVRVRVNRIISQQCIFSQDGARIEAEAVNPPPHPEAKYVRHRGTNLRVAPIEVWLLQQE